MESAPASICPAQPIEISSGSECNSPELKGSRKKGADGENVGLRVKQPAKKGQGKKQEAGEEMCKEKMNRVSGRGRGRGGQRGGLQVSMKKKGGHQKRCLPSSGDTEADMVQDRWGWMRKE